MVFDHKLLPKQKLQLRHAWTVLQLFHEFRNIWAASKLNPSYTCNDWNLKFHSIKYQILEIDEKGIQWFWDNYNIHTSFLCTCWKALQNLSASAAPIYISKKVPIINIYKVFPTQRLLLEIKYRNSINGKQKLMMTSVIYYEQLKRNIS